MQPKPLQQVARCGPFSDAYISPDGPRVQSSERTRGGGPSGASERRPVVGRNETWTAYSLETACEAQTGLYINRPIHLRQCPPSSLPTVEQRLGPWNRRRIDQPLPRAGR